MGLSTVLEQLHRSLPLKKLFSKAIKQIEVFFFKTKQNLLKGAGIYLFSFSVTETDNIYKGFSLASSFLNKPKINKETLLKRVLPSIWKAMEVWLSLETNTLEKLQPTIIYFQFR